MNNATSAESEEQHSFLRLLEGETPVEGTETIEDVAEKLLEEDHAVIATQQLAVIMIFISLLIGQVLHHCTHKLHIPYTPVLTVFGVVVAMIEQAYIKANDLKVGEVDSHEPTTGEDSHSSVPNIVTVQEDYRQPAPEIVFLIFLPALIFESAFNSDWYTFKR